MSKGSLYLPGVEANPQPGLSRVRARVTFRDVSMVLGGVEQGERKRG
jgi:hypothetical protein